MTKPIEPSAYSRVLREMEAVIHEHKNSIRAVQTELTSWHTLCEATYERMIKAIAAFTEHKPTLEAK